MKNITKNYTLYTFEELSEEAQEKAAENFWMDNADFINEGIMVEMDSSFESILTDNGYTLSSNIIENGELKSFGKTFQDGNFGGVVSNMELQSVITRLLAEKKIDQSFADEVQAILEPGLIYLELHGFTGAITCVNWFANLSYVNNQNELGYLRIIGDMEKIIKEDLSNMAMELKAINRDFHIYCNSTEFGFEMLSCGEEEIFLEDGTLFID